MTEQGAGPGRQTAHGGLTESEMDQQRLGEGLGDTVDGKNVAAMGRREGEPPGAGSGREPLGAQPGGSHGTDAGDIEDLGPDEAGPDAIEEQTGTGSGSSGL